MTKRGHSEIWLDNPGVRLRLLITLGPALALYGHDWRRNELDHSFILTTSTQKRSRHSTDTVPEFHAEEPQANVS